MPDRVSPIAIGKMLSKADVLAEAVARFLNGGLSDGAARLILRDRLAKYEDARRAREEREDDA